MDFWKSCVGIVIFIGLLYVQNNPEAAPGDGCTDTSNCTDSAGQVCDGSQCVCDSDYFQQTDTCQPIKLGDDCMDNSNCSVGNASCVASKCTCDDGFYNDTNDSCKPKVKLDENCNSSINCLAGNASCQNDTCSCDTDFYKTTTDSCLPKVQLGENCTNGINCLTGNASCLNNTCSCNTDFYSNNTDSCLPKSDYDGGCTGAGQCKDNLVCYPSSSPSKCLCADNLFYNGSVCQTLNLQQSITVTSTTTNSISVIWSGNDASSTYYTTQYTLLSTPPGSTSGPVTTKTATITSLSAGTPYSLQVVTQVIDKADPTRVQNYTVVVQDTWTKQVYGGVCGPTLAQCEEESNTVSCIDTTVQSVCLCRDGLYRVNGGCVTVDGIKPKFTNPSIFSDNITVNWEGTTAADYTTNYEVTWTAATSGTSGMLPGSQKSYLIPSLTPARTYTVTVAYVITRYSRTQRISSDSVSYSTLGPGFGRDCDPTTTPCNPAHLTVCENNKCLCSEGNYWNGNQCSNTPDYLPTWTTPTDIGVDYILAEWTAVDSPYYTSNYQLTWSPGSGGPITVTTKYHRIEGLSQGTPYNLTLTRIMEAEGRSRNLTPVTVEGTTKIAYNQSCTSTGLCIDAYTDCNSGRCRCSPGYYRDGACITIETLKPTSVTVNITGTTSLSVGWTGPDNSVITGYEVTTTPSDTSLVSVVGGVKTAEISGLTPGRNYTVQVRAKITYLLERVEMTGATNSPSVRTKPEKVTGLDLSRTNRTAPVITIVFPNPPGDVTSYTVQLTRTGDLNYSHIEYPPKTENVTSTTFSGVTPNLMYQLTILSNSGGVMSDPFTTDIRVQSTPAGYIQQLSHEEPESRRVSISWRRPAQPNGDIYQYTLEVSFSNSTCTQLVVFNCTECSTSGSADPNQECSSKTVVDIPEEAVTDDTYVIKYNITDLLPDTTYVITVAAYNQQGRGMANMTSVVTRMEAAGEPTSFSSPSQTSSTITLTWTPPVPRPGVTSYNLTVYEDNGSGGTYDFFDYRFLDGYAINEVTFGNLSSYWRYNFDIRAGTSVGKSEFVRIGPVMTKESAPRAVKTLSTEAVPSQYNKIRVMWVCPDQKDGRNGVIRDATLTWTPQGTSVENRDAGTNTYPVNDQCEWSEVITVTPEYNYTFTVYLSNSFMGENRSVDKNIPPGPPPSDKTSVADSGTQTLTTVVMTIHPKDLNDGVHGVVTLTGLLVCPKDGCPQSTRKRRAVMQESDYRNFATWGKSEKGGFQSAYRATPDNWIDDKKDVDTLEYVVGENTSCSSVPYTLYCNGQLPSGTEFKVIVFSCTKGGCTESSPSVIKTKVPDNKMPLIIGVIVAVVVVLVIAVVVILILRRRRYKPSKPTQLESDMPTEELIKRKRPIRICDFKETVETMHKDSNLLFSEEFEDITTLSAKHVTVASETGGNKLKNRYVNILPFDHSRVKLLPLEDDEEETDYINANYIPGFNSLREYIATQGPMTGTINDFWRMIWEQNVPIIVMLSDLSEKGKPKVDRYYPENNDPVQYGDIVLEMTNFSPLSKYMIRIFKLRVGEETREVRHYFLPGWQDFGANLTSDDVINFVKSVRMEVKPNNKGPVCVHCSAGVGRTGTYVSLDVFQQHIDKEDMKMELDIFDFVLRMRQNRSYMVQTEKQYIFVHDTIKEMIDRKMKEIAERDNIYQNTGADDNIYANQGFEADPEDVYMNVDSSGKPTTVL